MTIRFSDITGGGIPYGDNAGRPASPTTGKLYSNGEAGRLELYTSGGTWENIVQEVPGVSGIQGNYLESSNSGNIIIIGTNFASGAIASAIGTNGVEVIASSTTFNSIVQVTAVFNGLSGVNEPYNIKVMNPSNLFGVLPNALYVNAIPVWQTTGGSLGTFREQVSVSISATATDSDSTITYALASGSTLPSGVTLNSSSGLISGTLPDITSDITYNFTIDASDGVNPAVGRSFSITSTPVTTSVEYLVIAGGGGGGGGSAGGGGGGGGFRTGTLSILPSTSYSVSVGNGGLGKDGTTSGGARGDNGENSVFASITSVGGGGGGGEGTGQQSGANGGSGGGACYQSGQAPGTGTAGQGNSGGYGNTGYWAGGGGGAGGAGQYSSYASASSAGAGGPGLSSSITGTATYYAGGGGGATQNNNLSGGAGGIGGGGQGAQDNSTGTAPSTGGISGTPNTGGGGGGNPEGSLRANTGNGGSGVVILAYPSSYSNIGVIPNTLTYTLDTTTRSGYKVYKFTAGTGTITF